MIYTGTIPVFFNDFATYQHEQGHFFFNKVNNRSYLHKNSLKEIILDKNFIADVLETTIYFNMFCSKRLYGYTIKWALDTKMGLTELSGKYLLPSQLKKESFKTNTFLDEDSNMSYTEACSIMLHNACANPKYQKNKFTKVSIEYKNSRLCALICYPPNYNLTDTSQCILFHNPKNSTLAEYMVNNNEGVSLKNSIPQQAQTTKQCPLIMYDYVNTGINQKSYTPKATLKTMINNAKTALDYALRNFKKVHIYSEDLGYKIAVISLQRYLQENNDIDISRLQFYNITNEDLTSRELLANYPNWLVDIIGDLAEFNTNARSAMKYLLDSGLYIIEQGSQQ